MNQKIISPFIFALGISLALIACNSKDKKTDQTTTDTTKTETVQPPTAETTIDAVVAAPALYKVLKDTMGIRIVEALYKPGDSSAFHNHPDYAIYAAEGGSGTFYLKDGTKMENTLKTGTVMISGADGHSVKNTGKTTLKVILVEVRRPRTPGSWDASLDATKVSPNLYKSSKDSLGLRVIEVEYKPGQTSGLHAHPDAALYVTQGSTAEFTEKDGSKRVVVMDKGMAIVVPSGTHTVKNTGKTTMKGILVEVNRSQN